MWTSGHCRKTTFGCIDFMRKVNYVNIFPKAQKFTLEGWNSRCLASPAVKRLLPLCSLVLALCETNGKPFVKNWELIKSNHDQFKWQICQLYVIKATQYLPTEAWMKHSDSIWIIFVLRQKVMLSPQWLDPSFLCVLLFLTSLEGSSYLERNNSHWLSAVQTELLSITSLFL